MKPLCYTKGAVNDGMPKLWKQDYVQGEIIICTGIMVPFFCSGFPTFKHMQAGLQILIFQY